MNLKAKFMNLFKGNVNISKKILAGLLAFMIMLSPLAPIANANSVQTNYGTTKAGTQGAIPISTKADKVKALGGLDPVVMKKWVNDKLDWKDGVKAKDSTKETEVNNLLAGATFDDATDTARTTKTAGKYEGKIKVKFDDGSEIVVENQKLYVSDHVTWFSKEEKPGEKVVLNENTPDDALVVEFKLGEGTKVDNTTSGAIEGNKDNPVSYQKYKVKPNTDLKTYKNPILNETYYNLINSKVKAIDKYTEPVWNGKNGSVTENFIITESNKVFTATATKTYDITFDANTGGGTKDKVTQKANTEYELPASNTFTPPANKEFSGWQVGDDSTNLRQPGSKITITGDTTVKAIWKDIEHKDIKYKVTFNGNNGTGSMDSATVKKGEKYKLPENAFGAPSENQEFKTWEVDGKEVAPGTEITIEKDTVVKAIWKDIMIKITYNPNGGNWNNDGANRIIEVKKGTTITIMEAPVKDGFKFKYWKGSKYQPGDNYKAVEDHTFIAEWEENKKPGTSDVNPSEPGSKDKNGTQSRGTSSLNSKTNRIPKTGVNGTNMLYAFVLSFVACAVLAINRIYRKEK